MAFEFIDVTWRAGVCTIRLSRPPVNVLHAPMMLEIGTALDQAEASSEVCVIVFTGARSGMFSAGVEVADHSPERIAGLMAEFARLLRRLRGFSLPSVAALNGTTLGGAFELALACDMMIATPDARIGHPEIRLASIAFPGILMLQGRLPPNRIVELLASGEPMDGAEAHRLGLVNRLVDADAFDAQTLDFVRSYTRMSRPVLQLMMRTLHQARGQDLETGFESAQRIYLEELLVLEDADEGIRAFAEKRAPVWRHR
jgi:cyclohexa-1,5-dienecarbonyl-CoA hydratase